MLRIAITGAGGALGFELARALAPRSPEALDRGALDVTDGPAVTARLRDLRPDVVLNAAAYNRVDAAEDEPAEAFRGNALAPLNLARACREVGALLVHYSTDYVFGGEASEPYDEDARPLPLGVYGVSKLAGEHLVRATLAEHLVIRTCGVYGRHAPHGNFVATMLRLARSGKPVRVVDDQVVAPTAAADLAEKTVEVLDRWERTGSRDLLGLWHMTNAGSCTWHGFAKAIFEEAGLDVDLAPTTTEAYGARARRPSYSVLARHHLRRVGLADLRPWRDALREHLAGGVSP